MTHATRPEWGAGEVVSVQPTMHEGKPCQRVSVRFERAGLKTISTAVAELCQVVSNGAVPAAKPAISAFDQFDDQPTHEERLAELPAAATDPFASLKSRLEATLRLYRYSGDGAGLIDWAAAQTGLRDPLTEFSRHELEEHYRRFERMRDAHLGQLAARAGKEDAALAGKLREHAAGSGDRAMQRAIAGR